MSHITITRTISCGSIPSRTFRDCASMVLRMEKKSHAQIDLVFVRDAEIKKINKKFLSHNYATDVITFPIESEPILESEIYISIETAKKQAKEFRVSVSNELVRLVIHGILHLCGYDDTTQKCAVLMKAKENMYVETYFSRSRKSK